MSIHFHIGCGLEAPHRTLGFCTAISGIDFWSLTRVYFGNMSLRVGISSSFIEEAALLGVKTITRTIKSCDGEVPFILSTRQKGENPTTDRILGNLEGEGIPIVCVSSKLHRASGVQNWRDTYGQDVLQRLSPFLPVDMVFAFGDMTIWPKEMCERLRGLNLHPDLPGRFKGEWYNVIAQIVENRSGKAGVMIHLLTPELDKGPVITTCNFSLADPPFDKLWDTLPKNPDEIKKLIGDQKSLKENPTHPLWREIRRQGLMREFPLIELTLNLFAEGNLKLEGQRVLNFAGREIREGIDLSGQIDRGIQALEGSFSAGKERF